MASTKSPSTSLLLSLITTQSMESLISFSLVVLKRRVVFSKQVQISLMVTSGPTVTSRNWLLITMAPLPLTLTLLALHLILPLNGPLRHQTRTPTLLLCLYLKLRRPPMNSPKSKAPLPTTKPPTAAQNISLSTVLSGPAR